MWRSPWWPGSEADAAGQEGLQDKTAIGFSRVPVSSACLHVLSGLFSTGDFLASARVGGSSDTKV